MTSGFRRRKHVENKWKDMVQSFPFQNDEAFESIAISSTGKSRVFQFKDGPEEPFMIIFNSKVNSELIKPGKPSVTPDASSSLKFYVHSSSDALTSQSRTKSAKKNRLKTTREHSLTAETMQTRDIDVDATKSNEPFSNILRMKFGASPIFKKSENGFDNLLSPTEFYNSSYETNTPLKFFHKESKDNLQEELAFRASSGYKKNSRPQSKGRVETSPTLSEDLKNLVQKNYQKLIDGMPKNSPGEDSSKAHTLFTDIFEKDEFSSSAKPSFLQGKDDKPKHAIVYGRNSDTSFHLLKLNNTVSRNGTPAHGKFPRAYSTTQLARNMNKSLSPVFFAPPTRPLESKVNKDDMASSHTSVQDIIPERTFTTPEQVGIEKKGKSRAHKHRQLKIGKAPPANDENSSKAILGSEVPKAMQIFCESRKKGSSVHEKLAVVENEKGDEIQNERKLKESDDKQKKKLLMKYAENILQEGLDEDQINIKPCSIMKNPPIGDLLASMPAVSRKLREDIDKAIVDLNKNIEKKKRQVRDNTFLSKNTKNLNELDIKKIYNEYEKKTKGEEPPDYDLIDSMVSKLKFFVGKTKNVRISLLKSAYFAKYPSGAIIFRQGDYGDLMYIILRGSVNVRIKKATIYGTIEDAIVAVLYDGSHFGEYAMLKTAQQTNKKDPPRKGRMNTKVGSVNLETGEEKGGLNGTHEEYKEQQQETKIGSIELPTSEQEIKGPTSSVSQNYQERSKRAATIEVAESVDLLCIPRLQFQAIFLSLMQRDLDAKIQILQCLPFFTSMDPQSLAPLANNLRLRMYKLGDYLVKEGSMLDRLTIVSRGRCKLILEMTKQADTQPMTGLRGAMSSLKNITVGMGNGDTYNCLSSLVDYSCKETATRERDSSKDELLGLKKKPETKIKFQSQKTFENEKLDTKDGKILVKEHVVLRTFSRGEFFGGRGLLEREDIDEIDDPFHKYSVLQSPAKLSVVGDSSTIEVFELPKEHLSFVPNFLLKILIGGLKTVKEFDEYNIEEQKKAAEKWIKFKEDELRHVISSRINADQTFKKF